VFRFGACALYYSMQKNGGRDSMSIWKHTVHSSPDIYHADCSEDVVILQPILTVASDCIGAVKQEASVVLCRGRRIRFQAEISTEDTEGAGLWLTANHKNWHVTDGMYDRLIKGSTSWSQVQLVIDVPDEAAYISYGLWMFGNGKCRMRNAKFDIVDHSVAITTDQIWDRVGSQKWKVRPS
jgi:hypothetical protein